MAARPGWSGFLRFNLISVPVNGYNAAATGGGRIGFHLLHAKCHERIRYKKVCPVHGEVGNDEIVSGYEVSKGQYVEVPNDERAGVKSEDDKIIAIEAFVRPNTVDPVFFSGKTYFLVPDGKVAQKPYVVMLDAMREQDRFGIARVVFAGRPQLALVHPCDGILAMTLLSFESELKNPSSFAKDVEPIHGSSQERQLAETLIKTATADRFDLSKYKDEYNDRLSQLVEGKAKHAKNNSTSHREEPAVLNLMDALRKSLNKAKGATATKIKVPAPKIKRAKANTTRKTG
jgi:DNA end-binding protein Ku